MALDAVILGFGLCNGIVSSMDTGMDSDTGLGLNSGMYLDMVRRQCDYVILDSRRRAEQHRP